MGRSDQSYVAVCCPNISQAGQSCLPVGRSGQTFVDNIFADERGPRHGSHPAIGPLGRPVWRADRSSSHVPKTWFTPQRLADNNEFLWVFGSQLDNALDLRADPIIVMLSACAALRGCRVGIWRTWDSIKIHSVSFGYTQSGSHWFRSVQLHSYPLRFTQFLPT